MNKLATQDFSELQELLNKIKAERDRLAMLGQDTSEIDDKITAARRKLEAAKRDMRPGRGTKILKIQQ
jgi:hypothetical protein